MSDQDLLAALQVAERENPHTNDCKVCSALRSMSDPVKAAALRAIAGTIGRDKLVAILAQNGYPVGRRHLERHRREAHTP